MDNIQEIIARNTAPKPKSTAGTNELGKDAFMQLLLVQMQQQDPLEPMDNQQMLAQMAQFSSLEQMQNLNSTFEKTNNISAFMSSTNMLGKEVEIPNPLNDGLGALVSKVESIKFSNTGPILNLENGMAVNSGEILSVREPEIQGSTED